MITASVVTFHTSHVDIDNLLRSVESSSIDIIYVIDNSNNDSLRDYLQGRPKVKYIKNINNGYGAGHNIGIRQSVQENADYHIVINPDIYWEGPVIEILKKFMDEHPNCGLSIPSVFSADGEKRLICRMLPTPYNLILRRFIHSKSLQLKNDEIYQLKFTGYDKVMKVPSISGCFMFLRVNDVVKINGFDERFFMYLEDVDLSRRMGQVSDVMYCPYAKINHVADRGSYKSKTLLKYHLQSAIKYFNKWGWLFDPERKRINQECLTLNRSKTNTY